MTARYCVHCRLPLRDDESQADHHDHDRWLCGGELVTLGAWKVGTNFGAWHAIREGARCGYRAPATAHYTEITLSLHELLSQRLETLCRTCGTLLARDLQNSVTS